MRRVLFFALVAIANLSGVVSGNARPSDRDVCLNHVDEGADGDRIVSCSSLISSGTLNNADLAEAFTERASEYEIAGKLSSAAADYTAALKLKPSDLPLLNSRAQVYHDLKKYDLAVADYNVVIKANPTSLTIYKRGSVFRDKGDITLAIADFTRALALDPINPRAYASRGVAYRKLGDRQKAAADFNSALLVHDDPADNWAIETARRELAAFSPAALAAANDRDNCGHSNIDACNRAIESSSLPRGTAVRLSFSGQGAWR